MRAPRDARPCTHESVRLIEESLGIERRPLESGDDPMVGHALETVKARVIVRSAQLMSDGWKRLAVPQQSSDASRLDVFLEREIAPGLDPMEAAGMFYRFVIQGMEDEAFACERRYPPGDPRRRHYEEYAQLLPEVTGDDHLRPVDHLERPTRVAVSFLAQLCEVAPRTFLRERERPPRPAERRELRIDTRAIANAIAATHGRVFIALFDQLCVPSGHGYPTLLPDGFYLRRRDPRRAGKLELCPDAAAATLAALQREPVPPTPAYGCAAHHAPGVRFPRLLNDMHEAIVTIAEGCETEAS